MPDPFVPHQPQEKITVTIYKKEAELIARLRQYAHGKFTVHKYNKRLVRLEINESRLLEGKGDIDL